MSKEQTVVGTILAVQEDRFRMVTDTGQGLLLTLTNTSRIPAGLSELQRTGARVRVTYEGRPNLASGVVKNIDLF